MKPEIPKLPEGIIHSTLQYTGSGKDFLNRTPITQKFRSTINKWESIRLAKKQLIKSGVEEHVHINYATERGLVSRIWKELKQQGIKKTNDTILKF